MRYTILTFTFLVAIIGIAGCSKSFKDETAKPSKAIDTANFNYAIKPGEDFFRFVNGGWMHKNPIPADESRWGAFNVLAEENQLKLKSIFEEAANKNAPKGTDLQKIGDFYASGMDTIKIEADGIKPLKPELDIINNAKTTQDLQKINARFTSYGMSPLFTFYASQDEKKSTEVIANFYQGGLGMPDRDYYTSDDAQSKELRTKYLVHLKNMFVLMGETAEIAEKSANTVMKIETQLAKASKTRVELRDPISNYNKMTIEELQSKTKDFDWNLYFDGIGLKGTKELNVCQPAFFVEMSKMMTSVNVEEWKTFYRWKLVNSMASYLSNAFVNENFDFFGKVLSGKEKMKIRWKRISEETSSSLGEAVGKIFVEKYFPPKAKERMLSLVSNLKIALGERIKGLTWMSAETKTKAEAKLAKINVKIGYPDKWRDYSSLNISRDTYVTNVLNASKFEFKRNLAKIGKPVDRDEWGMTPQTVNAYYSPNMNEIVFPAAILQPPFFDLNADDAVNYGAIGVVIGHEMTHGFDDQGRQYDKEGNLQDWWTKEDADKFTAQVAPLIAHADSYKITPELTVNGKLTIGENIADFGGLTVSLTALRKATNNNVATPTIDGYTPLQRYFISYAQVWRQNIREKDLMRRLKEDVHSPADYRVNGALPNVPEFYSAFGIKETDKLFLAPDKRALIW